MAKLLGHSIKHQVSQLCLVDYLLKYIVVSKHRLHYFLLHIAHEIDKVHCCEKNLGTLLSAAKLAKVVIMYSEFFVSIVE